MVNEKSANDVRRSPIHGWKTSHRNRQSPVNVNDPRRSPIPATWKSLKGVLKHAAARGEGGRASPTKQERDETESVDIFCDGSSPESSPYKSKQSAMVRSVRPSSSRRAQTAGANGESKDTSSSSSSSNSPLESRSKRIDRLRMRIENSSSKSKSRNRLADYNRNSPTKQMTSERSMSRSPVEMGIRATKDKSNSTSSSNESSNNRDYRVSVDAVSGLSGQSKSMLESMSKNTSSSKHSEEGALLNGNRPNSRASLYAEDELEDKESDNEQSTIISQVQVVAVGPESSPEREALRTEKKRVKWSKRIPSCYDEAFAVVYWLSRRCQLR